MREFVVLLRGIADVSDGSEESPFAAIDAVLGAIDAAGGVAAR